MNPSPGRKHSPTVPVRTEISIWLDSYNDIFSDFDSRPVSVRTLSDDFVAQAKKICKESKGDKIALRLFMPSSLRKSEEEKIIIQRLNSYFSAIHRQQKEEARETNMRGVYFILAGIALMISASYISFSNPEKFYTHLLLVLFEPAGWFMLWAGLDHLIYFSKNKKSEFDFHKKMENAQIEFNSY